MNRPFDDMSAQVIHVFPWAEILGLAMGRLGWSPAMVWAATPREVALALGLGASEAVGGMPLDRSGLNRLCDAFPDQAP